MTGRVDDERRPLLRLSVPDSNQILAIIDTGFNGELWLTRFDAMSCGVIFEDVAEQTGYTAGMREVREAVGELRIMWFGAERIVGVVIDLDSTHRTIAAGEPMALIGTALLAPSTMTLNFARRRVTLRGT